MSDFLGMKHVKLLIVDRLVSCAFFVTSEKIKNNLQPDDNLFHLVDFLVQ